MDSKKVCCENCKYWVENIAKSIDSKGNLSIYEEAHDGVCHREPQATLTVKGWWCSKFTQKDYVWNGDF